MKLLSRFLLGLPARGQPVPLCKLEGLQAEADLPFILATDGAGNETQYWLDCWPGSVAALTVRDEATALRRIAQDSLVHNRIQWNGRTLTLESDSMGLKPLYHAALADGSYWFATRLADLLALHSSLRAPLDTVALHSLFTGRGVWGTRTLHAKISRLASGERMRWQRDEGARFDRDWRWQLPEANESLDEVTALRNCRETFNSALIRICDGEAPALSLSGGYDSRMIAAALPYRPLALTYGAVHQSETRQARAVASALKLPQRFAPLDRDAVLDGLASATSVLEGQADIAAWQAAPMNALDLPIGTPLLHGFPGDVVAGSFTARMQDADFASHDALARGIVRAYGFQGVDAAALFGFAFDPETLIADVLASLDQRASPLAAYHLWCWESHLRRYTAAILAVAGQKFDVRLPFVQRDYINLWAKVPLAGLRNRAWFRRWFASEWPALAAIAHPDSLPPSLPRRLANRVAGPARVDKMIRNHELGDSLYDAANLLSNRQAALVHAAIDARRPALKDAFGLELPRDAATILDDPRYRPGHARRILLGVADYAHQIISK